MYWKKTLKWLNGVSSNIILRCSYHFCGPHISVRILVSEAVIKFQELFVLVYYSLVLNSRTLTGEFRQQVNLTNMTGFYNNRICKMKSWKWAGQPWPRKS